MTIEYYRKNVYGNELIYIKDEKQAEVVRGLTNQKTVSDHHISCLTALGFEIVEVLPPKK